MKNQKFVSIVLSVVVSFLGVVALAYGVTTISTGITTAGVLTVTGNSILATASTTGQVNLDSLVVGLVSRGVSMTQLGAISASSTLTVGGASTFTSASSTGLVKLDRLAVGPISTTATAGDIAFVTASSTSLVKVQSLKVGASGTSFTKMIGDYCTIADTPITASTTGYMDCTARTTGLVAAGNPVWVTATSSLHKNFIITQASSSKANTIGLAIYNSGQDITDDTGLTSLNFFLMTAQELQ